MQKADLLTSAAEEGSNDGCTRKSHSRRSGTWSKSQSRVNTFKNQFPLQNRNTSVANAGSRAVREVEYAYAFAYGSGERSVAGIACKNSNKSISMKDPFCHVGYMQQAYHYCRSQTLAAHSVIYECINLMKQCTIAA